MENKLDALDWLNNTLGQFLNKTTDTWCQITLSRDQATEFIEEHKKVEQTLLKVQEQEKENEILKEIIKSLFDRGCPLHQYNDRRFGLTIEVDKEFSIMHLGEFKGIDLNKKLKEVLEK